MNWKYKYDVNKHVRDGEPEHFKKIAKIVFDELNGKPGFRNFNMKRFLHVKTIAGFDKVWGDLYDYADANGIWLGL